MMAITFGERTERGRSGTCACDGLSRSDDFGLSTRPLKKEHA